MLTHSVKAVVFLIVALSFRPQACAHKIDEPDAIDMMAVMDSHRKVVLTVTAEITASPREPTITLSARLSTSVIRF